MTVAVCHKCGDFKWGAFNPCEKCGAQPRSDAEVALCLAMSDHYYDEATLKGFSAEIQAGRPASVDPVFLKKKQDDLTSPAGLKMRAAFAAILESNPQSQPKTAEEIRREWSNPEFVGNAARIAAIVCRHFRTGVGAVTYRANQFLDPSLVKMAKELFKKPFFSSWNSFLPEQSLRDEKMFEVLAPGILVSTMTEEARIEFWDGTGRYLKQVKLADISSFTGHARLSPFAVSLAKNVYAEVRPYLQPPKED